MAISFLHSYINPAHEERARDLIARLLPHVAVTISSEVCREIREYERTSTVVANAYVLPMMDRYLARMQEGLHRIGASCPLLLMMSSGGICTVETARRFPVRLVESGPAGGAILARHVAARGGYDRAISFDMGGTTAKITLIDDYHAAAVAAFRGRARLSLRQGQRLSRAHPGDRHGGDRRRRRFHRARRSAAAHRRGARQRGCRSRARLLCARRHAADGDRCRCRARPHRPDALRRRQDRARSRAGAAGGDRDDRRAAVDAGAGGGARHRRDRRRDDGERGPRARGGERQGDVGPHADRVRRRGAAACRAAGAEARHSPRGRAAGCRRRFRTRLPRCADRVRGRAHAAGAARCAGADHDRRAVRRDARGGGSGGAAWRAAGSAGRDAHRLHALSRPGARGRGAAARRRAGSRRTARGVRCDVYTRVWPRHSAPGSRGGDLDAVARRTA